ncbi:acyl carrier protein [Streptomyces sp. NPDC127168]|uniref:acyl carrier protein n=1 Tax=unclassified Streptomyces TaxID=2593676 RepID=UPI00362E5770
MSFDHSRTRPPTALVPVPDDLLTELVDILAAVLHLKSDKVDPGRTFRSLGLDSLLTVEFVATVNARYGTAVKPDALFDHPTPLAFARHVIRERGAGYDVPAGQPPLTGAEFTRPRVPAAPEDGRRWADAPAEPAPAHTAARETVLEVLREELARILCCDPWELSTTAPFNVLGIDSILAAQFVATVNEIYGMHERPVTLYDHPDLAALAAHIASVTGPGPAPGAIPDLADLLDAVRDDRISVDEALALLPRRA